MRRRILELLLIILCLFHVPSVLGITFDGINFIGEGGGVVTFDNPFTAISFTWVNGLNYFTGIVWGGKNVGIMAYD